MVKGEDMGKGLPKNNYGNDSLYFQSLNSASAFESRAGSGFPKCTDASNIKVKERTELRSLNRICNLTLKSQKTPE